MTQNQTAAEMRQQLKDRMNQQAQPQAAQTEVQQEPRRDRYIKGTFIDDNVIECLQKAATIIFVVAILGALWLFAENKIGVKNLVPWRVWTPTVFMLAMMFLTKPFLRLGWFGWAFVLVQSINLSGYLFQAIQSITGIR